MKKNKKSRIGAITVILVVVALIVFFLVPLNATTKFVADDYNFDLNCVAELDGGMPVMSQETGYTCFVVSMAIVRNYFGLETTENELLNELNTKNRHEGMLPKEYITYFNEALEPLSYSASLINPKSQAGILNAITKSLIDGLPVVFFYSAIDDWNKPNYNTHYGVIYGIDMGKKTIKISNPYGYLQELSFTEMFEGLAFQSYELQPFMFHLGVKTGVIKINNLFILEKSAL